MWRNQPVRITFDDDPPTNAELALLCVCNGQYFGAGMWAAPQARLDDGRFTTILLDGMRKREVVAVLGKVYAGRHLGTKGVSARSVRRVPTRPCKGSISRFRRSSPTYSRSRQS